MANRIKQQAKDSALSGQSKMAATLVEGQKYGLDSNDSTRGNKTFIHFKLTDSALRAIEEFARIKEGCSRKPSIQFTNETGVMSIPGQVSSHDPKAERRFRLNLSKIVDANGSFDCVQQTRTRQSAGLCCLGSMQYKVSTNANNDVYTDTRKKIAIADNESKKICAKEIKMSGRFSGKKIKKVIPSSQYNALNTGKPASLSSSRHPSASLLPSSSSQSSTSSANSRLAAPSSAHSPHNPVGDSSSSAINTSSLITSKNGILSLRIGNNSGEKCSPAVNMPLRDRVIHLLALRSYKKPELVYRLMRDGIHQKDRSSLDSILQSVSSVNKGNSYSLAKEAWQYFRADWPLYSDADRQLAKRNQQAAESRSSASPAAVSPAVRPSPSPPQKRANEDPVDVIPPKKQRIAHRPKHCPDVTNGKLQQNTALLNGAVPSTSSRSSRQLHHRSSMGSTGSTGSFSNSSEGSIDSVGTVTSGASDKDSPVPESPSSNCENQVKGDEQDSSLPDYMLQFTKIETCAKRLRYKDVFTKEYAEYRQLHEKLDYVGRRFVYLKERIDNAIHGSPKYEELCNMVLKEYAEQKSDVQYQQHKKRVDYLHGKLAHIKQLITDYDRDYHVTQCS